MDERVLLPSDVIPTHYKLDLVPDLVNFTFGCTQEIHVVVNNETSQISLHSKEISIQQASFRNTASGLGPSLIGINYDLKMTTVTLTFDDKLPLGEGSLSLQFQGILNGDMAGFYKSTYSDADGNKKIMASTQFEAIDARRAFPCWDEPARKATFSVSMTIPSHLTALSNMPEIESKILPGGKKRVLFEVSPKMSTYLLAWAVGEFDVVQAYTRSGVSIRVLAPPGRAEQGKFALDVGVRALEFFDDFFNVPYPLPKMDMLCVTEFAMGAMENWGLVTYRENALMIDPAKASPQAKQRVAIVVAHELAHQWFGNLVTMSWWDGLWLNEGFANFMEHLCSDALFPEYRIWEQYTTDALGAALRLDSLRSSHPIIVPIRHAHEVEQVFDAISYCKGSTVVNMIYTTLGPDHFRAGLQLYMKRHAYGNTETSDLWAAWSEVSGMNLGEMMSAWTLRMGYPYLTVEREEWGPSSLEITLKQQWFLADGSSLPSDSEDPPLWHIPLVFCTSGQISASASLMTQREQTFSLPLSSDKDWVKINSGQKALARVVHTPEMIRRLSPALSDLSLSPVDRAALLLDSYALAKAGVSPVEDVVSVLRAMSSENDSTVWSAISSVLAGLSLLMEEVGGEGFAAYTSFAKSLVISALSRVGWDSQSSDSHTDKLLRATVFSLLDIFGYDDPQVSSEAKRRFLAHFSDPSQLPSEYKMTVYRIVLLNGGQAEFDQVLQTFYATEDNQERKYSVNSLGYSPSPALKTRVLDWSVKSGDVKLQDFFYPIGTVSSNSSGCALSWEYFQSNFDFIKEKLSKASPSLMDAVIVNCTLRFCTRERADEIDAFFSAHPLPQSSRRVSQIVENMRSNAKLLDRVRASSLVSPSFWTEK